MTATGQMKKPLQPRAQKLATIPNPSTKFMRNTAAQHQFSESSMWETASAVQNSHLKTTTTFTQHLQECSSQRTGSYQLLPTRMLPCLLFPPTLDTRFLGCQLPPLPMLLSPAHCHLCRFSLQDSNWDTFTTCRMLLLRMHHQKMPLRRSRNRQMIHRR